ncbi:hypothetical protein L3556_07425 [Candidatus Synechococcus calcipolaris G9]|uniref:Uncharacterized protein n=1 Tax=Candidatus Synechococcus calcipolaris G9 TaxID=1497997 RepID=A0ABT6EY90_9SYNE|nr:hypothetical protein [Candidatus Synechococcus calcipolaris]MDG2990759.1 hypothetical protein [Candidatus Synechococcus calcipolaris G9]
MSIHIKILPFFLAIAIGIVGAVILSQLQISFWWEPNIVDAPTPLIEAEPTTTPTALPPPIPPQEPQRDGLRVSNQTSYPLRIVLLNYSDRSSQEEHTTHWDFAPMEGNIQGLLLSLPEGNLRLKSGDILMAFSLDGSKRYWGPYIIGESQQLQQDSQTQEWQLTLRP